MLSYDLTVTHCLHTLSHSGTTCSQMLVRFVDIQTSFHIDRIDILSRLQAQTAASSSDVCSATSLYHKIDLRNQSQ